LHLRQNRSASRSFSPPQTPPLSLASSKNERGFFRNEGGKTSSSAPLKNEFTLPLHFSFGSGAIKMQKQTKKKQKESRR